MTTKPQEVSLLLRAWSDGDQTALDKLMPLVYEELRRMAKRHMDRQGPGHTLQTTALIHVESLLAYDEQARRFIASPPDTIAAELLATDRLVRHCLEKNQEDRFQSMADIAFYLDAPRPRRIERLQKRNGHSREAEGYVG